MVFSEILHNSSAFMKIFILFVAILQYIITKGIHIFQNIPDNLFATQYILLLLDFLLMEVFCH